MQDKHILIVEDEKPIRDMLRMTLERANFKVSEADGVPAARIAIVENRPDDECFVLDRVELESASKRQAELHCRRFADCH